MVVVIAESRVGTTINVSLRIDMTSHFAENCSHRCPSTFRNLYSRLCQADGRDGEFAYVYEVIDDRGVVLGREF